MGSGEAGRPPRAAAVSRPCSVRSGLCPSARVALAVPSQDRTLVWIAAGSEGWLARTLRDSHESSLGAG